MKKIINIDEQLIIGYFDDSEKDKTIETLELVWEYVSYDIDGDIFLPLDAMWPIAEQLL